MSSITAVSTLRSEEEDNLSVTDKGFLIVSKSNKDLNKGWHYSKISCNN